MGSLSRCLDTRRLPRLCCALHLVPYLPTVVLQLVIFAICGMHCGRPMRIHSGHRSRHGGGWCHRGGGFLHLIWRRLCQARYKGYDGNSHGQGLDNMSDHWSGLLFPVVGRHAARRMLEKRIPRKTYRQLKHHAIVKKVLYTPSLVLSYMARVIPSGREQTGQYHLGLLWCLGTARGRDHASPPC